MWETIHPLRLLNMLDSYLGMLYASKAIKFDEFLYENHCDLLRLLRSDCHGTILQGEGISMGTIHPCSI